MPKKQHVPTPTYSKSILPGMADVVYENEDTLYKAFSEICNQIVNNTKTFTVNTVFQWTRGIDLEFSVCNRLFRKWALAKVKEKVIRQIPSMEADVDLFESNKI